jgi:hypothetical protein
MANSILVKIDTQAPDPRMHPNAAPLFEVLRKMVIEGSGVDFLARCGDVTRPADFVSNKPGVANRSWHKTGRAFDYDQSSAAVVIVGDAREGKQYFRTYIVCAKQDGSQGRQLRVMDIRGYAVSKYLFDFTAAAEACGFKRIPAWKGWEHKYIYREFWHYQHDEGLTWDAAMQQLKGIPPTSPATPAAMIIGLNDRDSNTGGEVTRIQKRLSQLGLLPSWEIDGIFGAKSKNAVEAFQRANKLAVDGTVGPKTRNALNLT